MARIFVTGSADGLGRITADHLLAAGHDVIVHVRAPQRRSAVADLVDRGARVVVGDLGDRADVEAVAAAVNAVGACDAVVHNAGVYNDPRVLPVNVVAPYLLTALVRRPKRLICLSSGLHRSGRPDLDVDWSGRRGGSYADSKLFVTAFAAAVARRWPDVLSHAVDPGWLPTRMGGPSAPDDLRLGSLTQEWLATSDDAAACTSGGYWHHQRRQSPHPAVGDVAFQDRLLAALAAATGVTLPA